MSILEMSLAGGCIVLTATILRAAGKNRLPVGAFESLWALAWVRLMLPVRLPFRFSAWTLIRRFIPHTAGPGPTPAAVARPGQGFPEAAGIIQNIPSAAPADAGTPFPTLTALWLTGAAVCALALALCYIRARRRLRDTEAADESYVNQFLAGHPLRRHVSVRVSDRVNAPLTYGIVRPVVLLPRTMDLAGGEALGYVLAHELAHIRRFDAARKLALAAAVCLHWFDPLVWLMAALAGRDMERACDRAVVDAFGPEARRDYAMALLDLEERRAGFAPGSAFARNAIEERIHSIMKIRPRSFLSTAVAAALVLAVGAVFATADAPEDGAVAGGADVPAYIVDSGDASAVFSGDVTTSSDGTVYVFTTDGKPVSMTQQEYKLLIDPVEVEWWTAEEYAAWLEQEKKDLQDCLGQRAWTGADGWFTWTQEKIDETIEMYEQVLEDIENGLLVSKTVDGRTDVGLMQGGADDGWVYYMMTEAEDEDMREQNEAAAERQQLEQQLAQLDQERAALEQRLEALGEAEPEPEAEGGGTITVPPAEPEPEAEGGGTITVPPDERAAVFFSYASGPYGEIESGGRVKAADVTAAKGSTVSVGLQTRTDAVLTVSLLGSGADMEQSVQLKAGQTQTVTFYPEQEDTYSIYITNSGEYPADFIVSWNVK